MSVRQTILAGVLAMAVSSSATGFASPSVEFAYATADGNTDFYGLSNLRDDNTVVFCATRFDAADLAPYVGNRISHLTVYSPTDDVSNPQTDIELFIYEDELSGNPDHVQRARISGIQKAANRIALADPVEIRSGKNYYVGYKLRIPYMPFYYMPVDLNAADPERCISGITYDDSYPANWDRLGKDYGSLCLGLTITGDRLPDNWGVISSAVYPSYLAPSAAGSFELTVENKGVAPVETMSVRTRLADGHEEEFEVSLDAPIPVASSAKVTVDGLRFNAEGCYEISSEISRINGKEARPNPAAPGTVMVFSEGFQRQVVIEEAGGSWCQWCPAGMVMLDNIRKDYPENFNCISIHQGDALDLKAYYPFLARYFSYFPASIINRTEQYDPAMGHSEEYTRDFVKSVYDRYMSYPALGKVGFSFTPTPDGKKIKISAQVEFALDLDRQYLLSFVLTEDNVGPYLQTNAYYTGDYGVMGGWENRDFQSECMYNDVARELLGFPGIDGSLPSSVRKGQKYSYDCTMSLSRVTGSDWRVVALLTDASTGEIVNSAQVLSDTYSFSSVRDILNDEGNGHVGIEVVDGTLSVTGASRVAVYSINGELVSSAAVSVLPQGLYIVRADSVVRKIAVR